MREPRQHIDLSPRAVFKGLVRWGLSALGILVLLVGLFYVVENVRGYVAWKRYKAHLEARGERLDWSSYIPKAVPDDQNFTQTPLLQALTHKDYAAQPAWFPFGARTHNFSTHLGDWTTGHRTDLEACREEIGGANAGSAAQAVLDDYRELEPALAQLRAAVQRPYAQFSVPLSKPWEGVVPSFVAIRQLVQLLSAHASAELAANHTDKAFEDVLVLHKIAEALRSQPTLVSAMIRIAVLGGLATQPVWEGMIDGKWSEAQLAEFQKLYSNLDFFADLRLVFRGGERAAINELIDKNPAELRKLFGDSNDTKNGARSWKEIARDGIVHLSPSGWKYQNQLFYNRTIQDYLLTPIDTPHGQISPRTINDAGTQFQRELQNTRVFGILAAMAVPNVQRAAMTAGRYQTQFQQLALVCALERYRHKNNGYPERLDQLVPQFVESIPREPFAGNSLQYERTDATHFTLYSFGWDGKDDGGTISSSRERGDWVWFSEARQ